MGWTARSDKLDRVTRNASEVFEGGLVQSISLNVGEALLFASLAQISIDA